MQHYLEQFLLGGNSGELLLTRDRLPRIVKCIYLLDIEDDAPREDELVVFPEVNAVVARLKDSPRALLRHYPEDSPEQLRVVSRLLNSSNISLPLQEYFSRLSLQYLMKCGRTMRACKSKILTGLIIHDKGTVAAIKAIRGQLIGDPFMRRLFRNQADRIDRANEIIIYSLLESRRHFITSRYDESFSQRIDAVIQAMYRELKKPTSLTAVSMKRLFGPLEDTLEAMLLERKRYMLSDILIAAHRLGRVDVTVETLRENMDLVMRWIRTDHYRASTVCYSIHQLIPACGDRKDALYQLTLLLAKEYMTFYYRHIDPSKGPMIAAISTGLECAVCYDSISKGDYLVRCARCHGGIFCIACYKTMRLTLTKCPMCRAGGDGLCRLLMVHGPIRRFLGIEQL